GGGGAGWRGGGGAGRGGRGGRGGPGGRGGLPVVKITSTPPDGARDALDGGADMLVVDDPATLEYAARLRGYTDAPLEWSRTYVLLVPAGERAGVGDLRLESLREAVHGDARPAE